MTAMEAERNTMTGHRGDTVPANQGDTTMAKQSDTIEAKQGDTKRKQLWRQYNVTRARDHAADEASAAAAGVGLSALRKQAVFHFDVQRHPLLPVMLRCLGFNATGSIEEDQTLLEGLQPPASSAERTGCSGAHRRHSAFRLLPCLIMFVSFCCGLKYRPGLAHGPLEALESDSRAKRRPRQHLLTFSCRHCHREWLPTQGVLPVAEGAPEVIDMSSGARLPVTRAHSHVRHQYTPSRRPSDTWWHPECA